MRVGRGHRSSGGHIRRGSAHTGQEEQGASRHREAERVEEGIQNGEFRPDINAYLVRAMIWGTIEHLVTRKSLLGKPQDLLSLADDVVDTIFNGILTPQKEPTIHVSVKMEK